MQCIKGCRADISAVTPHNKQRQNPTKRKRQEVHRYTKRNKTRSEEWMRHHDHSTRTNMLTTNFGWCQTTKCICNMQSVSVNLWREQWNSPGQGLLDSHVSHTRRLALKNKNISIKITCTECIKLFNHANNYRVHRPYDRRQPRWHSESLTCTLSTQSWQKSGQMVRCSRYNSQLLQLSLHW